MSDWKESAIRRRKYRRGGLDLRPVTTHARRPRPYKLQYKMTEESPWFRFFSIRTRSRKMTWRKWHGYHDLEGIRQAFPKISRTHPSYLWRVEFNGEIRSIESLEDI